MKIGIAGGGSKIAREFIELTRAEATEFDIARPGGLPTDCNAYLFCTGYMTGKSLREIHRTDADVTFEANFVEIAKQCDRILEVNANARICIIGSESGCRGSFDMAYAGAKAAMHLYVETKKLVGRNQMIVALAPHIIADAAMTERRPDLADLMARGEQTRLGRWLTSREVAQVAHDALLRWPVAMSGQVIRMRCE